MRFEYDVFISYAHIDNKSFTREQEGWVTVFDNVLQIMLNQQLGKEAKIWRDKSLQGNDDFSSEISDKLPNAATLVSVLTPRYLTSGWCTKEIQIFCQLAEAAGGLFVKNKGRVFKVVKSPIARIESDKSLPPAVSRAIGYEFFIQPDGEAATELDPVYGKTYEQAFYLRLRRLAGDIADLLRQFGDIVQQGEPVNESIVKPVYLAECCSGRKVDRERVLADLRTHGYTVIPDDNMPGDEIGYVAEAERLLAQCQLSIHLIGSSYGPVPDGDSQKSTVVLQNEIAARLSRTRGLPRIISLPSGTSSTNVAQQAFIDSLVKQSDMQEGADLVTDDLQTLLGTIHTRLMRAPRSVPAPPSAPVDAQIVRKTNTVHVLYDEKDSKDIVPLLKYLKASGIGVTRPVFNGQDAGQVREANQSLCMGCDAVILFYGAGDQTWMYYQQTELKKRLGLRTGKPILAEVTVVAGPVTPDKDLIISMGESDVVDMRSGFSESALASFIGAVQADGGMR